LSGGTLNTRPLALFACTSKQGFFIGAKEFAMRRTNWTRKLNNGVTVVMTMAALVAAFVMGKTACNRKPDRWFAITAQSGTSQLQWLVSPSNRWYQVPSTHDSWVEGIKTGSRIPRLPNVQEWARDESFKTFIPSKTELCRSGCHILRGSEGEVIFSGKYFFSTEE
jgi:hypothetical protein